MGCARIADRRGVRPTRAPPAARSIRTASAPIASGAPAPGSPHSPPTRWPAQLQVQYRAGSPSWASPRLQADHGRTRLRAGPRGGPRLRRHAIRAEHHRIEKEVQDVGGRRIGRAAHDLIHGPYQALSASMWSGSARRHASEVTSEARWRVRRTRRAGASDSRVALARVECNRARPEAPGWRSPG